MAEELGRIQRPPASQYDGRRKLLLVPLIYGPQADDPAGAEVLQNYWEQMQTQVEALEAALGGLQHIYHESLTVGGDEGLEQLGAADQRSHGFIASKTQSGAVLEATEDMDVLLETLDLQRCMMIPLASASVGSRLQEWHAESNRQRYDYIASQIDSTLGENETGLLLISERHQVQFPTDVEVFITNITTEPAEYNAVLWLNSQVQANASVTIGRLSTEAVVFTTQLEEGEYSVRIDKLLGDLTVGAAGSVPTPSPAPTPDGTPAPTPLPGATLTPAATAEPGVFADIPGGGFTTILVAGIVVGVLALLAVGVAVSKS